MTKGGKNMKQKLICILLIAVLICNFSVTSFAADGSVTFTADAKMVDENLQIDFSGLEPGDVETFTVSVRNQHRYTTRWYMSNEVLKSLEDNTKISGGAYTYVLTYKGPKGNTTKIYDSTDRANDYVGGEHASSSVPTGLHEATSNLENFFFLDTLNSGESGTVTLTVGLEGETQDNSYQNTDARVRMNFAVELSNPNNERRTAVKTGDENNLVPYYIGMVIAGLLFLYLALDAYTDRKFQKGRGRK